MLLYINIIDKFSKVPDHFLFYKQKYLYLLQVSWFHISVYWILLWLLPLFLCFQASTRTYVHFLNLTYMNDCYYIVHEELLYFCL